MVNPWIIGGAAALGLAALGYGLMRRTGAVSTGPDADAKSKALKRAYDDGFGGGKSDGFADAGLAVEKNGRAFLHFFRN